MRMLDVPYESCVHRVIVLSILPSLRVGALLAHTELTMIALIGIILLITLNKNEFVEKSI